MKLLDYIRTDGRPNAAEKALAEAVGTNERYLWQIATGRRKASPALAKRIETATGGKVKKAELRPDIWGNGNGGGK